MAISSSSSLSTFKYDVFVNFHGHDTGRGFTSQLVEALRYRKINAFFTDEDLEEGGEITPSPFVNAIQDSKIAIIVLSDDYASSRICLEELSYILDNFQGKVIPVFYNVEPSDVRRLKGSYDYAFGKLKKNFKDNEQKLQKWKNALYQIANISGFPFRQGVDYESKFIERIVNQVFFHTIFTVGLESPLKEVTSLLEWDSGAEVHKVGIYGAAGIGKTTLARVVYGTISDQFEASYFLPDVGENSNSNIHGLTHLQNMLLSEMVGMNNIHLQSAQEGSVLIQIQKRLQDKKVLLVLDGVDKLEQLDDLDGVMDWFGSGSRIIITTRDRSLLTFREIERRYEVLPLNDIDALELLSRQIFKDGNADPSNIGTLNELVTYAAGLPLALKVIGSHLFGKSVVEWTDALRQFKWVPAEDIQRKLKSSFDALREDEKRVFLDIACCFSGYELRKAIDILSAHRGPNVESHIKVLINRSLVRIDSDDMVRLHPLVEEMGKEIVRQESPDEPGKRSRLWYPEDIVQVLQHNMGTDHTEIIHLDSPLIEDESPIEWDGEAFKKMKNLRTLIIREWNFSKAPKYLPNSLRVLEWWKYPSHELPSDFNTEHLVICRLPDMGVLSTRVKNRLDRNIRFWSSGGEMDIRILLAILHHVMWHESGWEKIEYMSITQSSQVKKAYRSALLLIHPDNLQKKGTTLIQKYIAENVFPILQSAMSVHEASLSSQEVSPSSQEISPTSQSVPGELLLSSQVSPTSMGVSGSMDPPDDPESDGSSDGEEEGEEPSNPPRDSEPEEGEPSNPHSDPGALSNTSQEGVEMGNLSSASGQLSNSSQGGAGQGNLPSGRSQGGEGQGNLPSDSSQGGAEQDNLPEGIGWETWFWMGVGTASGAVGSLCFALSPPSKCSNGGKTLLWILCTVWFFVILAISSIVFYFKSSFSLSKLQSSFLCSLIFLMVTVYSFFYDKAVDNNPSKVGAISNLAFALMSLSKSELDKFGFDTGIFCYFLACFITQLGDINVWLCVFGTVLSFPLVLFHFFSILKDDNQDTTLALLIQNTLKLFNETLPLLIQKTRDFFNETLALLIQKTCNLFNKTLHLFNPKKNQKTVPDRMPNKNDTDSQAELRVVAV